MLVFVYGTLKIGEPNHHWLSNPDNGKATFVSTGKTVNKFPLTIASRYNIPFLLDHPGVGKHVQGELFEIDEKMLLKLDVLEEYPKLYTRRQEPITVTDENNSERTVEAWTYLLFQFRPEMLDLPQLDSYASNGPHNLPYAARYVRDKTVDHRVEVKVTSTA